MRGALSALAALAVAAPVCGPSDGAEPAVEAAYGERFVVALGESADVEGEYRVRFDRMSEDSRCPAGARCAQAGNAAVALGVESERGSATLTLHTDREPRSAAAMGGEVRLVALAPRPAAGAAADSIDYRATLVVSPAP